MRGVHATVLCPECGELVPESSYASHRAERHGGEAPARAGTGLRLALWLAFVLALTALGYASRLGGGEVPDDIAYRYSSSIGALVQYGLMLGVVLLIGKGLPKRELFALRRPRSWPRAIAYMGLSLVAVWGAGAALSPFLDAGEEQGLVPDEWDPSRAGAFVAFFVVVAVVAPIVEEILYRGLGYTLLAGFGTWTAIVVTGVVFGASHGLLVALPILTAFGIVLGWLRSRTESLYPPVLLHAVFNGAALIVSVTIAG